MRQTLTVFFFLNCFVSKAQFFREQSSFSNLYFQDINLPFVQKQKIKSVTFTYSYKEDNQRIMERGIAEKITFTPDGLPEKKVSLTGTDTIETFYYFVKRNLTILREFNTKGISTIYFSYDSAGNKTSEVHCLEENAGESRVFFKIQKQEIAWSETYSYQALSDKQVRRKTMNDKGIVYKDAILYLDDKLKLKEESERFSVTGVSQNCKYNYTENGVISEKVFYTDVVGVLEEKSTFTYAANEKLGEEKFYRNGVLKHEKIYFYNSKNELPEAVLTKYPQKTTIEIKHIHIEFY